MHYKPHIKTSYHTDNSFDFPPTWLPAGYLRNPEEAVCPGPSKYYKTKQ